MKFSEKLANFIVKARWYLFGAFLALTIASVFLIPMVGVNYDMTKYLPENSDTKVALKVMEDEFGASGVASIMIENATLDQINAIKGKITEVDGVASVVFDSSNSSYYDGENGLLKVFFNTGDYTQETATAIDKIRKVCSDYEVALGGSAVEATTSRNAIGSEMIIILLIAVAIVIAILLLTSRSWLEPLVYLCVIGCAIVLNMGTNLILGEISFITQSISAIMLIALEMDYCIVLCSRFREEQEKGLPPKEAMTKALAGSFMAIIASSCTVIAGLVALMFMDFSIGFDIGAVLAKGVFISIIAVIFFMPSIILMLSRALNKTKHRSFLPKMDKIGTFANKTKYIIPAIFLCIVVAGIVLQTGVQFSYVASSAQQGSQLQIETSKIEETFGKQNSLVVMVEKGKTEQEIKLYNDICAIEIDGEKYINSKSAIVDTGLYNEVTPTQLSNQFGLDSATINKIYQDLNKQTTDKLYLIEVIEYLHNNNTVIADIGAQKQQLVDALYTGFANYNIYLNLNATQAQAQYNLSDAGMMQMIYAQILGIPASEVTDEMFLPNWAVMEILYTQNIDNYQSILDPIFNSTYKPFDKLTMQQIMQNYGLPQTAVAQIFAVYNEPTTGSIRTLQLMQALNTRTQGKTIIDQVCASMQGVVDSGYLQVEQARDLFISENYSRMIFNLNLAVDDEKSIAFINELNSLLKQSDYNNYYIANNTSNLIETQEIFKTDRLKTDLITIFAILLIVLLTFRSISIPVLLVLAIQGAIWCNLAISNLAGESVFFVCYLLAMAIQMGATIDYGILLTDRYINFRKKYNKVDSLKKALNTSITTILTSGLILILAAFIIHFVSTTPIISEIGLLIGRGALISVIVVIFVLPQLLLLFDKVIEKTTLKQKFFNEKATQDILPNADTTLIDNTKEKSKSQIKKEK